MATSFPLQVLLSHLSVPKIGWQGDGCLSVCGLLVLLCYFIDSLVVMNVSALIQTNPKQVFRET